MTGHLVIVGAGVMGAGIGQTAIIAGWTVTLYDVDAGKLEPARRSIVTRLERAVTKGDLSEPAVGDAISRLRLAEELGDLADATLVIEAATESLELKQAIMRDVDERLAADRILGTNTSSLSITEIAAATRNPDRVLGIHFFNPAPVMRLVEVIPGARTSPAVVATASEFAMSLGKTPVRAIDRPGFIVSRILDTMVNEAIRCVMDGNAPEDVDAAMTLGANLPIGPLALADLMGLDVLASVLDRLADGLGDESYRPAPRLRELVETGKLGRKSGSGFYEYPWQ